MLKRQETLMQWGLGQYSSKVHPVNKQMDWLVIENNFLLLTKFCFFFHLKIQLLTALTSTVIRLTEQIIIKTKKKHTFR